MIKKLSFAKKTALLISSIVIPTLSSSCSTVLDLAKSVFQNPKVGINSFNYVGTDASKIKFNLLLNVENPNTFGIKTSGINYNLDLNNSAIINGNLTKGLEIAASAKNNIEIPIDVNFQSLLQIAPSLISNPNNINYNVYGIVNFDTPIGAVPINWKHQDILNVQNILNWSQILFPTI
jgi:LEA14-like dessication related protein